MTDLCEGGNETPGSLKAKRAKTVQPLVFIVERAEAGGEIGMRRRDWGLADSEGEEFEHYVSGMKTINNRKILKKANIFYAGYRLAALFTSNYVARIRYRLAALFTSNYVARKRCIKAEKDLCKYYRHVCLPCVRFCNSYESLDVRYTTLT
ncbi:hypothetical protein ANN_25629 [Periplaneta americana]|uniref:Uncharacterized protein n=1 Tax=Periplaneta americana TaxID=6978 RepID=A0ABQ8S1X9_PERAM|nr:hypothetical protein ANN_25629 [Periplaneta americana]